MNLVESWMNTDASLNNQPIRIGVVFYKHTYLPTRDIKAYKFIII